MDSKDVRKYGLIGLSILIYLIILKIFWKYNEGKYSARNILTWSNYLIFVLVISYFIYLFIRRKKADDLDSMTMPKDIVNSEPLKDVLKEELIKRTNIPYYLKYVDGNELIKPINPLAIKFLCCKPVSNGKTPNSYYGVEVQLLEGDLRGLHTIYVPKDGGLKGVRENCMMYLDRFTTFRTGNPNPNEWDNVLTHNQIIDIARLKAETEGAEDYELDALKSMRLQNVPDQVILRKESSNKENSKSKKESSNDNFSVYKNSFLSKEDYEKRNYSNVGVEEE